MSVVDTNRGILDSLMQESAEAIQTFNNSVSEKDDIKEYPKGSGMERNVDLVQEYGIEVMMEEVPINNTGYGETIIDNVGAMAIENNLINSFIDEIDWKSDDTPFTTSQGSSCNSLKNSEPICDQCYNSFKSYTNLKRHKRRPEKVCSICEQWTCNLKSHIMLKHPMLSDQDLRVKSIIVSFHGNGTRAYMCKECGKKSSYQNVKDHIEAHHVKGICLPCSLCGKEFRTGATLRMHKTKHHKKEKY